MKKIVEIKIIVDTDHSEIDEWLTKKMFIENELDEAIYSITTTPRGRYRNRSGKTDSGACTFSMKVTNAK